MSARVAGRPPQDGLCQRAEPAFGAPKRRQQGPPLAFPAAGRKAANPLASGGKGEDLAGQAAPGYRRPQAMRKPTSFWA
jgi:hypothetical protein